MRRPSHYSQLALRARVASRTPANSSPPPTPTTTLGAARTAPVVVRFGISMDKRAEPDGRELGRASLSRLETCKNQTHARAVRRQQCHGRSAPWAWADPLHRGSMTPPNSRLPTNATPRARAPWQGDPRRGTSKLS
eukprot:837083-Alexandrium_andersonii.AAC.1